VLMTVNPSERITAIEVYIEGSPDGTVHASPRVTAFGRTIRPQAAAAADSFGKRYATREDLFPIP